MGVDIERKPWRRGDTPQHLGGQLGWWQAAQGSTSQFWQMQSTGLAAWHTLVAADIPSHNLLSATHGDTIAGTVVRGDLIVGDSTPKWVRFAKGTSGTFLKQGANDPAWTALAASDIQSGTLALARGGTNADLSATGGTGQYLKQSSSGAAVTVATIADTDVPATWTTPGFNAANFTGGGGTWTVASGDVLTYAYTILNKRMLVSFSIATSSVSGTTNQLSIAIPASKTATKAMYNPILLLDNGTPTTGYCNVNASGTTILCTRTDGANFAAATDTTYVLGQIEFEIN